MKKILTSLIIFLISLPLSACSSNNENITVKNGTYVLEQPSTEIPSPCVIISDDNISFSYDALSSYHPQGIYTIENDILTMTTDDKKYKYVFQLNGDKLIFQENGSSTVTLTDSEFGVEITDNAEFKLQDN
ncbi:MAG: hypothetical protein K0S04_2247 [Herbinix sp.]|nr:hypothetical protein [Herbinix sp.]